MNLDDIKDRVLEALRGLWSRVQDSPTYSSLKDRYDSLPPQQQKLVALASGLLGVLILLSIPYSYYSASTDEMAQFQYFRDLTRQMLSVEREVNQVALPSSGPQADVLRTRLEGLAQQLQLTPEQIESINPYQVSQKGVIPAGITPAGFSLKVKQLNIKQVSELGTSIEVIDPQVRIWNVNIRPSATKALYFDAQFDVVSFILPLQAPGSEPVAPIRNRFRKKPTDGA